MKPGETRNIKQAPLTAFELRTQLNQHRQYREFSCFQSAPEMWLKLNNVISWTDYPEQSISQNDGRGYEPYPDNGTKPYNGVSVHFRKETFHPPYDKLFAALSAELSEGRYVVVSLHSPGNNLWHGYIVTHKEADDFIVFTKSGPNGATEQDHLKDRLSTNEKVDCLFMRIGK
jgi:hypothetical protein